MDTRVQTKTVPTTQTNRIPDRYVWQPRPINIWLSMKPRTQLEQMILDQLQPRLVDKGCIFVDSPRQATRIGPVPHLAIGFGDTLEQECSPFDIYGKLPKPRASVFMMTVVDKIPDVDLFDLAREQLVKKAAHFGALFEKSADGAGFGRVLWGSMAGNYRVLQGDAAEIFDGLALRILTHASAEKVNFPEGTDEDPQLTWEAWAASPVHGDIAEAARRLGEAGIIDNEVYLHDYGSADHVKMVLRFLERGALGEGMRSQLDAKLRVMGITTTGGDKVNVSPDPKLGQIIPIRKLTWSGYVQAVPADCPVKYTAPSIETHENGLIYLAGALINAGLVRSYDGFLQYLREYFAKNRTIDILPAGMQPRVTAIDHFHKQPKAGTIKNPERVELVAPDTERFPEIDFPCGVREGGLQLLSAVFRSETFTKPGGFDKLVIVVLPGHGSVALYNGPRSELTQALVQGMEMEEVKRV